MNEYFIRPSISSNFNVCIFSQIETPTWTRLYTFLNDLKCNEYTQNLRIAANHLLLISMHSGRVPPASVATVNRMTDRQV